MEDVKTGRATRNKGVLAMAAAVVASLSATVVTACGDSATPGGQGNDVVNDTRDSSVRAPANPDDGSTPLGQPDGSYQADGAIAYDDAGAPVVSFPGVSECSACTCGAAYSYCFGGGTARSDPQAHVTLAPYAADAGVAACPMVEAGALGCTALPPSCVNANLADDCSCLALLLQPLYDCVLNCAFDGKTSTVYCPNP